jgi:hypothetical protein
MPAIDKILNSLYFNILSHLRYLFRYGNDDEKSGRLGSASLHSSTVYEISPDILLSPDLLTAVTTK